jgi:hypothetical protein
VGFFIDKSACAPGVNPTRCADNIYEYGTAIPRMRWHTRGASSLSSAGSLEDIFRLIPPNERAAFGEIQWPRVEPADSSAG